MLRACVAIRWALAALVISHASHPARAEDSSPEIDAAMTARVDELLAERWRQASVEPAAPAADGELLRRLYLDLTGVIPPVSAAREFLADSSPNKRERLIDELIDSPAHATHLANVWRDLMLARKFDPSQVPGMIGLQNWLRRQFVDRKRYDRIVADLLVATGGDESGPALFYTAVGVKPEELGTTTSRIFLGIRLDCAQCHDHPFDRWTQQDFWGYAAFFAQLEQRARNTADMRLVDVDRGEVKLPDSETVVPTRYPGSPESVAATSGTRRQQLAIWMVSRDNPYLGRAAVNLVWSQLFGRGLVEPLDDAGEHNPASHPELLTELSEWFVGTGYDLERLFRLLARTRAYQLSSRPTGDALPPAELFAAMAVKTLSAEQLYDSLARLALRPVNEGLDPLADQARQAFLVKLHTQTRTVTDFELGVPQALTLMNGAELARVVVPGQSELLMAIEAPYLDDAGRVDTLFLSAFSRYPTDSERTKFAGHISGKQGQERAVAVGDLVWALVNSAEFVLNP